MQIPQLTFTRFLASISIVLLHYGWFAWPLNSDLFAPLGNILIAAMSYFFILSGFILVVSSAKDEILPDVIHAKDFWKRRAARILPVYLLALIVVFCIDFNYDPTIPLKWQIQSYYNSLVLIQSWDYKMATDVNYPAWSLSVEAFFYFIFPWLYMNAKALSNKTLILISVIAWLLNYYIFISLKAENAPENFIKYFPLLHVATFLTGMCCGILFVRNYSWLKGRVRYLVHASTIFLGLFIVYKVYRGCGFCENQHNGLLSPFYISFIFSLCLLNGKIAKMLSWKPFIFLGTISYAVYIMQYPINAICVRYIPLFKNLNPEMTFYMYVLILILISTVIYLFIEKPARNWLTGKKAFDKKRLFNL